MSYLSAFLVVLIFVMTWPNKVKQALDWYTRGCSDAEVPTWGPPFLGGLAWLLSVLLFSL